MVMRLAPLALLLLSCWSSTLYFNVSATTTFTLLTKVRDHDVMVTGADTRSSMSQSAPPSEAVARDKMLNTGVEDAQRRLGVSRGKGWWGKMKGIFKSGLPEPTPGNTALDPRDNVKKFFTNGQETLAVGGNEHFVTKLTPHIEQWMETTLITGVNGRLAQWEKLAQLFAEQKHSWAVGMTREGRAYKITGFDGANLLEVTDRFCAVGSGGDYATLYWDVHKKESYGSYEKLTKAIDGMMEYVASVDPITGPYYAGTGMRMVLDDTMTGVQFGKSVANTGTAGSEGTETGMMQGSIVAGSGVAGSALVGSGAAGSGVAGVSIIAAAGEGHLPSEEQKPGGGPISTNSTSEDALKKSSYNTQKPGGGPISTNSTSEDALKKSSYNTQKVEVSNQQVGVPSLSAYVYGPSNDINERGRGNAHFTDSNMKEDELFGHFFWHLFIALLVSPLTIDA